MNFDFIMLKVLGKGGVILLIGTFIFLVSYKNSEKLFQWIEDQTFGARDFILDKCELLFFKIEPQKVTWYLMVLTFGGTALLFSIFAFMGFYKMGGLFAIIFLIFSWKIPKPIMSYLVERRITKFQNQFIDALNLMSSGLRAGLSLPQAFGLVVEELPNPISQEFSLVLSQNRLGVSLDECLENLYKRIDNEDVQMFVSSINILRETGGNLSETFDTIAEIVRERVRLKQKIDTYTAQARTQGVILCLMPIVILFVFSASDPETMSKMFSNPLGIFAIIVSFGLVFLGGFVMSKIIKIKA
ncbi:MAG: type II secretion system F family protein [Halobacteriovoraceae bacterium]|nr:type II secretion system F family protein [Halobacteriovoraceae bacterium]